MTRWSRVSVGFSIQTVSSFVPSAPGTLSRAWWCRAATRTPPSPSPMTTWSPFWPGPASRRATPSTTPTPGLRTTAQSSDGSACSREGKHFSYECVRCKDPSDLGSRASVVLCHSGGSVMATDPHDLTRDAFWCCRMCGNIICITLIIILGCNSREGHHHGPKLYQ